MMKRHYQIEEEEKKNFKRTKNVAIRDIRGGYIYNQYQTVMPNHSVKTFVQIAGIVKEELSRVIEELFKERSQTIDVRLTVKVHGHYKKANNQTEEEEKTICYPREKRE